MLQKNIEITPSVTVHILLKTYPELEEVLIGLAPPFKKLKNPFLRRTIAKVATIRHIASVGGIPLNELISKLRKEVGQSEITESFEDSDYFGEQPTWFSMNKVVHSIDESKLKDKDKMPLAFILKPAKTVNKGEIIELVTSFLPAPGIDVMKKKGYFAWTKKEGDDIIKSYFLKM
jgi:uncharacterized protein DUF1858